MFHGTKFTGLEISNLLQNCPKLKDFKIKNITSTFIPSKIRYSCDYISFCGYENIRDLCTIFGIYIVFNVQISTYNLRDFKIRFPDTGNTVYALQNIVKKCQNWRNVTFQDNDWANQQFLYIFTVENKLETIYIQNNNTLTTATVIQIIEANSTHLKTIGIYGCKNVNTNKTDEIMKKIIQPE